MASSNRELEQFAYVASHSLQEPIRKIISYSGLLAERYKGRLDSEADKFISYMVEGAERMHALIQGLLKYSRVGRGEIILEPTNMEAILDRVIGNLEASIRESGAEITRDPLPVLVGNPLELGQLLENLVANAIKFRGEVPPRVHVSAQREEGSWLFSVRDNGIGIDPENKERLFTIFQRLHVGERYPGTGIGLAMCRNIVERYGGRIWVESQAGQGSTFHFTWPASPRHPSYL